jgi:ACT domain-containing protein
MRAIVTVIGEDRVGIIAGISTALAEHQVNILDISQTVLQEYFTMIMLVDLSRITLPFTELVEALKARGETLGVSVKIQHEDIFKSMHHM